MITLTLEQAQTAQEIIKTDIAMSEFGTIDYESAECMRFYLNRAVLLERLEQAIKGAA